MAKERSMALREELNQFLGNAKKEIMQLYDKIKQHPLTCLVCIIVIVASVTLLVALPYWRVTQFGIADPKDLAEMENSYRATLAQILGGIAVGIGIYFAWGNLTNAREGQITERFTRAVDQLGAVDQFGNPSIEIRLGGIYALERVSKESEKDYWPIMEILMAYVRMNSNAKKVENKKVTHATTNIQSNENTQKEDSEIKKTPLDVQAALMVLGRRKNSFNYGESNRLNLKAINLQNADLRRVHLEGAKLNEARLEKTILKRAHLEAAKLSGSHLEEANLLEANLAGANLEEANLNGANLKGANLEGADFQWANLIGTNLQEANLQGTHLRDAHLEDAILTSADLEKAVLADSYLIGAHLERANLKEAHLEYANLKRTHSQFANLKGAHLEWSNLEGANLSEAYLEEANLEGTKGLSLDQLSEVKTLYNAKLDKELEIQLKDKYPALFEEPVE